MLVISGAIEGEVIDIGIERVPNVDEAYVGVLVSVGRADTVDKGCSEDRSSWFLNVRCLDEGVLERAWAASANADDIPMAVLESEWWCQVDWGDFSMEIQGKEKMANCEKIWSCEKEIFVVCFEIIPLTRKRRKEGVE